MRRKIREQISEMAKEEEKSQDKETNKIPVFTVLKKGSILKNIILNYPSPETESSPHPSTGNSEDRGQEDEDEEEEEDQTILIGRHPDCHVVLDHPSISRFHLEIRIQPSLQKLLVTDLSSVHGTWVSGNKIQPHDQVELRDGDTMRIGASTRVYELHWVSIGGVSEVENPLEALSDADDDERSHQVEKSISIMDNPNGFWNTQIPSAPPMQESANPSLSKENFSDQVLNQNQTDKIEEAAGALDCCSAIPVLEPVESSFCVEEWNTSPEAFFNAGESYERENPSNPVSEKFSSRVEEWNGTPEASPNADMICERENHSNPVSEKQVKASSLLSRRNKSVSFLRVHRGRSKESVGGVSFYAGIEAEQSVDRNENSERKKGAEILCRVLFNGVEGQDFGEEEAVQKEDLNSQISLCQKLKDQAELKRSTLKTTLGLDHEEDMFTTDKENLNSDISLEQNLKDQTELMRSPLMDTISSVGEEDVFHSDKENLTPQVSRSQNLKDYTKLQRSYLNAINKLNEKEDVLDTDEENLTPEALFRGELMRDQTAFQRSSLNALVGLEGEDVFLSDKENWTPEAPKDLRVRKILCESSLGKEKGYEEILESEEDNQTPQVSQNLKSRKLTSEKCRRIEDEIQRRRVERVPFQSLLESPVGSSKSGSVKHLQKRVHSENCQRFEEERQMGRVERVPFQSLLENSVETDFVEHSQEMVQESNSNSENQYVDQMFHNMGEEKKRWNIVVDTSCFLNEESRRSLQLLEGIRGTHLIIPRMVIRELDCLKRRESYFRKTMKVSSALQWIEECMVKTSWWIHVQSSAETMPMPPTPPASPRSQLSEGSNEFPVSLLNFMPFSTRGTLTEIVSPTAEDHILDCALHFRRIRNDGRIVLLTKSISLKIKAMAEGLLCETPKEFRESLVNPLSKRFLWVESSPRGPTWSCVDNAGPVKNYYNQDLTTRKTGKAANGAMGLKLVLLHNSHFGKTNLVK